MRSLFTKCALVAAIVALVPTLAQASTARVEGLGLQPDYIQDYVNVVNYPSTLVRYQNLVYGDLGFKDIPDNELNAFNDNNQNVALEDAGRAMGVYLGNLWSGRLGVWGVQMNENANPISSGPGAAYYNRNVNEAFTVLWGYKFDSFALGLQLNRSFSSVEDDNNVEEPYTTGPSVLGPGSNARQVMNAIHSELGSSDWNTFGAGAGFSWDWDAMGRQHTLDASIQYRSLSLEESDVAAGTSTQDDDNTALAFNARAQIATTDNMYLVPVFNYYKQELGTATTVAAVTTTVQDDVSSFNIGVSANWVLRDSDVLVLGAAYENQSVDLESAFLVDVSNVNGTFGTIDISEASYQGTPSVFAALEVHPTGWLHVRLGASKPWFSSLTLTEKTTGVETEVNDSPLQYAVGLGFRLGNKLDIDAVLNQDFAFTGSWAASGASEVPFTKISTTYRF